MRRAVSTPAGNPLVTLIRPVRGLENNLEAALRSSFRLSYANLELLFCVEDESDPVVPLARRLIADHPKAKARLLVGRDKTGGNPKVDNMAKGWRESKGEWVILSDSNVLLERDFVEALFAAWKPKVGLVSTAVIMTEPETFAAELESAFINSYLSRWLIWGDAIGLSFAFGKTLMWRRDLLAKAGGMAALSHEAADEISAAKTVRFQLRMKQRLTQRPVKQPIGRRDFPTIWRRQVRWARLRRTGYPGIFAAEPFVWALVAFIAAAALAIGGAIPVWALVAIFVGWYGVEAALTIGAGLPFSPTMPLAWIVRDFVVVPGTWLQGWTGKTIEWRGATISAARPADAPDATKPG